MTKFKLLLGIAALCLLFFTVFEIGYFFIFPSLNQNKNATPAPTQTPSTITDQTIPNAAVGHDMRIYINSIIRNSPFGIITKSSLTNTFEGTIVAISKKTISLKNGLNFSAVIVLQSSQKQNYRFFLTQDHLAKLRVLNKKLSSSPLKFGNLKVNDRVIINEQINIIEPDYQKSVEKLTIEVL